MLVGFVSDDDHVAIEGVRSEFDRNGDVAAVVRSSPSGSLRATLTPGTYRVTLQKDGFGPLRTRVTVGGNGNVPLFRMLRDDLLGYVTPMWVQSGDVGEYRIHATEETQVSLWRYGAQKTRIAILDWHGEHGPGATRQTLPTGDFTRTGVGWVSKNPSAPGHAETVRAPDRSGLYYFHLRTKDGEAFFSFPWVVAPTEPSANLAVLASTMTWNAYNNFGGRSNYVNPDRLPPKPIVDAKDELRRYAADSRPYEPPNEAYEPLSYERPSRMTHVPADITATDPVAGRNESHLAPAEWRFLAWLEREGYAYDLYADNQLHDGTLALDKYDALAIHTHPEYWSVEMYDRVTRWVEDRGGRLAYFGGNGINCAVEVIDDDRLRYLTHDGGVRNASDDEMDGFESRFARVAESEATLLGVRFTETGLMSAAPYEVMDADHWAFDGLDLAPGELIGTKTLQERCAGGASGHETDKRSPSSPPGTHLLAKGTNPDGGGAELVYRETGSGGAVFAAGSITYPLALLVDGTIAGVTRTVLDRFLD